MLPYDVNIGAPVTAAQWAALTRQIREISGYFGIATTTMVGLVGADSKGAAAEATKCLAPVFLPMLWGDVRLVAHFVFGPVRNVNHVWDNVPASSLAAQIIYRRADLSSPSTSPAITPPIANCASAYDPSLDSFAPPAEWVVSLANTTTVSGICGVWAGVLQVGAANHGTQFPQLTAWLTYDWSSY